MIKKAIFYNVNFAEGGFLDILQPPSPIAEHPLNSANHDWPWSKPIDWNFLPFPSTMEKIMVIDGLWGAFFFKSIYLLFNLELKFVFRWVRLKAAVWFAKEIYHSISMQVLAMYSTNPNQTFCFVSNGLKGKSATCKPNTWSDKH